MFKKLFPLFFIIFFTALIFQNFVFKGLLPIPSDILVGAYYPWLDNKWDYPVAVPVKNPLPSDVISILYPWRFIGIEILKSGNLPLWDSSSLLGAPLLANFQSALLNPLNILFLFFSHPFAWSIQVFLQPILIAFATFIFLRNLGLKIASSLFGGLAFAFSGFSLVWMEYNTIGFTLACIPLIFLFVDKIALRPHIIYIFGLALALTLQIFAGYPQISLYTLLFATTYFLYRVFNQRQRVVSKFLAYLLGITTAVSFSAVQLLPSLELLNLSIRGIDNTAIAGGIQFLPLVHLLTLFIPDFFGNPATANYWSVGSYDNFAFFVLPAALYFAFFALTSKLVFNKQYLIFVLFLGLTMIIATDNLISKFFTQYNILGLKSAVATRSLAIFDFSLVILSAVGLDRALSDKKSKLIYKVIPLAIYLGIALGIVFSFTYLSSAHLPESFKFVEKISSDDRILIESTIKEFNDGKANSYIALRNMLLPVITVIVIAIAFFIKGFLNFRLIFISLIFCLLFVNIYHVTNKYLTFSPAKLLYPSMDALTALKDKVGTHRFDRERAEILPSNVWVPYGLKASSGQNALYLLSSAKYFSVVNNMYPNLPSRYVDITNFNSPLYDTLDIEYMAVLNRHEKESTPNPTGRPFKKFLIPKFEEYKSIKSVTLLRNKENLGSAWFSQNINCESNEDLTTLILGSPKYDPRRLVVINCPAGGGFYQRTVGNAVVESDEPNYMKISVQTSNQNYLIISKSVYPGWKAYVDGKESSIKSANLAFMSVFIPEGNHLLELRYEPNSVFLGIKISVVALSIWTLILVSYYGLFRSRINIIRIVRGKMD